MSEVIIRDDAGDLLRNWGSQYTLASTNDFNSQPLPGPYLIRAGYVWQARRIYSDTNYALLTAILPNAKR